MKVAKRSSSSTKTNVARKVEAMAKKMVTPPTPPPPPAATPPAAKASKPKVASINRGVRTGLPVMRFQDLTYRHNDEKVRPAPLGGPGQRTDKELAEEWCKEFPNSRAVQNGRITEEMVGAVRRLYNAGTQGHGTPGAPVTPPSMPWVLNAEGKRVRATTLAPRTRRSPAAAAAQPAATKTKTAVPAAAQPAEVAKRKPVLVAPTATATATAKAKAKGKKKGKAA